MKNVLVLIHDDSGQEARLQAALDVTRALRGHLTCLNVSVIPSSEFDRALAAEKVAQAAVRTRVEQRMAGEDVPWRWVEVEGYADEAVVKASTLADLIVVNSRAAEVRAREVPDIAPSVAIKSGKPVLAVPGQTSGFDAAGSALVAWDGSEPAAAAARAAAPLLKLAQSIVLYEVDDGSSGTPGEEAAAYLSHHGVRSEIVRDKAPARSVDDLLLGKAQSGEFSYVVMGAYSRPRIVEVVLGGVSRRMLSDSPVPLLMAH